MDSKDTSVLKRLIDLAKQDPQFFHALIFNPEQVLGKLDFLDRKAKGMLVAMNPEELIGTILGGPAAGCDVTCTSSCGVTCSGSSCGYTTNFEGRWERILPELRRPVVRPGLGGIGPVAGCDVTCTSSCGATCNSSCGYTTNLEGFGNPVEILRAAGR